MDRPTLDLGLWTLDAAFAPRPTPAKSFQIRPKKEFFFKTATWTCFTFRSIGVHPRPSAVKDSEENKKLPNEPIFDFRDLPANRGDFALFAENPIKNEPIFIHFKNLSPLRLLPLNFPESRNWPCDLPKRARSGFGLRISFGYRISAFGSLSVFIRVHPCPSVVKVPKLLVSPMRIHATGFYCPPQAIFAHKHHGNHIFAGDSASPCRGTWVASLASKVVERHSNSAEKLSEPRI